MRLETIQHAWQGSMLAENTWRISLDQRSDQFIVEEHHKGILLINSTAWVQVYSMGFSCEASAQQRFEEVLAHAHHSLRVKSGQWQREHDRLNQVARELLPPPNYIAGTQDLSAIVKSLETKLAKSPSV